MPVSNQTQQLAQLMQAIQQQQAMAQMQRALTQGSQLGTPQGGAQMAPLQGGGNPNPPPSMQGGLGSRLQQLMGGQPPMGPQTLGVNQPIPMQMPNPDPQGQQQGTPLPPNPTDMQGG